MNKKITIIGILIVLLAIFAAGCVTPPTPPIPALTGINVSSASILVNRTHTFSAAPIPAGAVLGNVTWTVANTTVGTITPAGVFTARAVGTTTITARVGNITGTATATVTAPPVTPVAPAPQRIVVSGSTAVAVVADYLADAFMKKYPHITVEVHSTGSTAGIVGANEGTVNIGMSSRNLRGAELGWGLNETIICHDAIAVIVHPENLVTNISLRNLREIFVGNITNWAQVGGFNRPITVVIREDGSGTRAAFEELVHRGITPNPRAIISPGTGAVKTRVAGDRNSIGYVTMAALDRTVSPLEINGVRASSATVIDGTYGISRPFIMLTKGTPDPVEQTFLDFILSPDGQSILEKEGMVRVR